MPHIPLGSALARRSRQAADLESLFEFPVVPLERRREYESSGSSAAGSHTARLFGPIPGRAILRRLMVAIDTTAFTARGLRLIWGWTTDAGATAIDLTADRLILPNGPRDSNTVFAVASPEEAANWIPINVQLPGTTGYLILDINNTSTATPFLTSRAIVDLQT